jgi:hypothetical protein
MEAFTYVQKWDFTYEQVGITLGTLYTVISSMLPRSILYKQERMRMTQENSNSSLNFLRSRIMKWLFDAYQKWHAQKNWICIVFFHSFSLNPPSQLPKHNMYSWGGGRGCLIVWKTTKTQFVFNLAYYCFISLADTRWLLGRVTIITL